VVQRYLCPVLPISDVQSELFISLTHRLPSETRHDKSTKRTHATCM